MVIALIAWFPAQADEGRASGQVLETQELRSGVAYLRERYPDGPQVVHVVQIALDAEGVGLRLLSGDRGTTPGLKPALMTVEQAVTRATSEGLTVLAAINGDQWLDQTGAPLGAMAVEGVPLRMRSGRDILAVGYANEIYIGPADSALLLRHGQAEETIAALNRPPAADGLALFLGPAGLEAATAAAAGLEIYRVEGAGPALAHRPATGTLVCQTHPLSASDLRSEPSVFLVPGAQRRQALARLAESGGAVELEARFGPMDWPVRSVVGGWPALLRDGVVQKPDISDQAYQEREPRTAVGYDARSRTLWWVVADGRRRGYSEGFSLKELTDWMVRHDVTDAINLDGGGSSTLWMGGAVANRPSDLLGARGVISALALIEEPCGESPAAGRR